MKFPEQLIPAALRKPAKPGANGGTRGTAPANLKDEPPERPSEGQKLAEGAKEGAIDVAGWVDSRTGGSGFLTAMLYRKVPKGTNWFYTLGSATLFAFVSQAVTGVFLAMYYEPDYNRAYESASRISNEIFLGELVRGMHRWGATVMIVLIFLHMGRTFIFGAYKYPREIQWVIGVILLVLTLTMGLTGYLLPFDQRSYWATVVAVNLNASAPLMGPYLADFLRGGAEFGAGTIPRFYALHMLLVPGLIIALIGAHLHFVIRLGISAPPWLKAEKKELQKEQI